MNRRSSIVYLFFLGAFHNCNSFVLVPRCHPCSRKVPNIRNYINLPTTKLESHNTKSSSNNGQKRKSSSKRVTPTSRSIAINALLPPSNSKTQYHFPTQRLEQSKSYQNLSPRDRSFSRLLVATVERRMGQLDAILGFFADTYPPKKGKHAALLQATLQIGAAQLLFLETPPHAAIKETVDVLKYFHSNQKSYPKVPEPMIKFVNAILRSISRHENPSKLLEKHSSPQMNIVPWIFEEFSKDWGLDATAKIANQFMKEPFIDLSIKHPFAYSDQQKDERKDHLEKLSEQLLQEQGRAEESDSIDSNKILDIKESGKDVVVLPHGLLRTKKIGGDLKKWPLYDQGVWWVQDASSALAAIALINRLVQFPNTDEEGNQNPLKDMHVVDMCSAPGGKCAQLLSNGVGKVTAIEANARRSRRLQENLTRLGFSGSDQSSIIVSPGQDWVPSKDDIIHGVLLDVPCSATGTGSKRPDVLRKSEDGMNELVQIQETLANHCADSVLKPGGIMVYATCSLLKRESEDQIHKLLMRGTKKKDNEKIGVMKTVPFTAGEIPGYDGAIDENGWLRVLPGSLKGELESCDGFFVARLMKAE